MKVWAQFLILNHPFPHRDPHVAASYPGIAGPVLWQRQPVQLMTDTTGGGGGGSRGGGEEGSMPVGGVTAKIVHFVWNPFEMALSIIVKLLLPCQGAYPE